MFDTLRSGRRTVRASLLSVAALAVAVSISACAPKTSEQLPDEAADEITGAAPDRQADSAQPGFTTDASDLADVQPADTMASSAILAKYSNLDPQHLIPRNLLAAALDYFDAHASSIKNKNYISVIDFAMPSSKRRFYIVNMETGAVFATTVAHGKGSDANNDGVADKFSNVNDSNASSLGVYVTAETYNGTHGLSLRLDGKSSTNSNVRMRAIVVHGAAYVQDREVRQGRSWGCPAVPMAYRDRIIGWLKGGSVIYANLSTK